ncbi:UvrD-helicase domain-containing protein [Bacillus sp. ISL-47]|uniref:UvrD-helicase domain-containing protein n=1 Tax=Bacillus sp. ISL-47 TaxID=2819130 RepID=UPI001BE5F0AE|nr:UvrD-helicase domain-containing protein [Bacillus sp. ISL-47]MBT2688305.1 UvrD-helicase domain-containing protein [Bacillus sp. ISL-47]MBT2710098.1 UvrD-helicase domain-containing protein [Pseudomonas sp. ISL-84]
MKTALLHNKVLNLEKLNRESYQHIYQEGKKGKLFCPDCGASVRLYLGISKEPHFYHIQPISRMCQDAEQDSDSKTAQAELKEFIERNGFQIPVSRAIASTAVKNADSTFKKALPVKNIPPYTKDNTQNHSFPDEYLQALSQSGIFLDERQAAAVSHIEGPLLVLAGAGSGKTRVLTTRTAFMLREKKIDPKSIMLVTFTAKAAAEMKERLLDYPGMDSRKVKQVISGTFHSLFYRILSFHSPEKWSSGKLLNREWQREQIIKEACKDLKLDEKEIAYDLTLQQISYWKNSLIMPEKIQPENDWEKQTAILYKRYEQAKERKGLFDFDDMLTGCYALFKNHPAILGQYQSRFQYFLIDEFQDINKVQYELMKMLSAQTKNICAVGDDDQSIYAFRGSDPQYLLDFEKDFPEAKVITLNQNYRSAHEIVSAANQIISLNKLRRAKSMNAQYSSNQQPFLFFPYDEEEEATIILTDIQDKIEKGYEPQDFAVLFRTHAGSRAVFERLANSSLPFKLDQDAESFYDRFIVRSMLSFLKLSINEDDQNAIKDILPSLFVKQTALQDIKAESILKDCSLLECLSHIKTGFAFQESKLKKVIPVTRSLSGLTPLTAIETVEKELGFQDFIKKRGNEGNKMEKGSDDLKDLKVAARNFNSLAEFIEHTEHMKAMNKEIKQLSKSYSNAITLSTIHRAKGLEYNVVYVVGAVEGSLPHDHALEAYRSGDSAPLEEERRLMYVAVTRAKKDLYISVPEKRRGRKAYPSRFLAPITRSSRR